MTTAVYTGARATSWAGRVRRLGPPAAVLGAVGACCGVVLWGEPTTAGGPLPTCPTKALFGVVCPGCGSLRMIESLLHGDVGAALQYNALGLVLGVLLCWSFGSWVAGRWRGRWIPGWTHRRWAPVAVAIAVAVWLVVRNLPFPPFAALAV